MKRAVLILLALAMTLALSGCWNSSGAGTAQPSPTAAASMPGGTATDVPGNMGGTATDAPGNMGGMAGTDAPQTSPMGDNAGNVNDTGVDPGATNPPLTQGNQTNP